jgi:hypothetical protein
VKRKQALLESNLRGNNLSDWNGQGCWVKLASLCCLSNIPRGRCPKKTHQAKPEFIILPLHILSTLFNTNLSSRNFFFGKKLHRNFNICIFGFHRSENLNTRKKVQTFRVFHHLCCIRELNPPERLSC